MTDLEKLRREYMADLGRSFAASVQKQVDEAEQRFLREGFPPEEAKVWAQCAVHLGLQQMADANFRGPR